MSNLAYTTCLLAIPSLHLSDNLAHWLYQGALSSYALACHQDRGDQHLNNLLARDALAALWMHSYLHTSKLSCDFLMQMQANNPYRYARGLHHQLMRSQQLIGYGQLYQAYPQLVAYLDPQSGLVVMGQQHLLHLLSISQMPTCVQQELTFLINAITKLYQPSLCSKFASHALQLLYYRRSSPFVVDSWQHLIFALDQALQVHSDQELQRLKNLLLPLIPVHTKT
jgi:hypothetical protein